MRSAARLGMVVLLLSSTGCTDARVSSASEVTGTFAGDCGLSLELPTSRQSLVTSLHQRGITSYVRQAPRSSAGTGDDVFPIQQPAPGVWPDAVEAIVALCGSAREGAILKSIRYAFFIDASGTVFHVEKRTLSTVTFQDVEMHGAVSEGRFRSDVRDDAR